MQESDIILNYQRIKTVLKESHLRFGLAKNAKNPPEIIAVTKNNLASRIIPLLEQGHKLFGENKVQEAASKWPELKKQYPNVELHLIGPLQSNKVSEAVALFDVIETLDREKIATAIAAELNKTGKKMKLFIQVNTGEEPQKSGILPADTPAFIKFCRTLKLEITGLMCIPPVEEEASLHFALLKKIAAQNDIAKLSMGMSADYELAAALGSDYVRIGTAIFGERN